MTDGDENIPVESTSTRHRILNDIVESKSCDYMTSFYGALTAFEPIFKCITDVNKCVTTLFENTLDHLNDGAFEKYDEYCNW